VIYLINQVIIKGRSVLKPLTLINKCLLFSIFVICALIFSTSPINAKNIAKINKSLPLSEYFTQSWSTLDGLPHNGINALSQTNDGYLWIGTWEGLARFNGRTFKVFSRGSKVGLPDSAVKSLVATQAGKLLVAGARGGLSERLNKLWSAKPLASTMVNHAIYDNEGNMWLALEGRGLVYRHHDTQQNRVIIDNLRTYKIAQDNDGTIWVATSKGLFSVKNKTLIQHFDGSYGLPNAPAHTVVFTKNNQLLVGTQQGAYKFVNGFFKPLHTQLVNERVTSILQDGGNNIWLGTDNHGIFRLCKEDLEQLDDRNGLPTNQVSALYQDKEQSIWVGTSGGLFRLREAPFITLTSKQGLAGDYVRSVLSHSDGSLWVGSNKGLNKLQNNTVSTIAIADNNKQLSILSLAENSHQKMLVGTYNSGLYSVINNKLTPLLTTEQGLPSNEIRSILADSHKNIWLGTPSGLVKIKPDGTQEHFDKQNGLPANFIMAIAEDNRGTIWIGTGNGLVAYNQGNLRTYRLHDRFDAEYAFGFHIEPNSLWMTTDRGLIHIDLNTNKMTAVTKKNGLPVDKLFQVVIDNNNTFWLTSNRGVISVTREHINNVLQGKSQTVHYELFAEGAGLLSSQANGGSTPSATLHNDGSVWVATAKGVSQVSHKRLQRMAETIIPVVIEQFNVDGKSYPINNYINLKQNSLAQGSFTQNKITQKKYINDEVKLPEGSSRITIHYAGLGFLLAKHIEYQTQLIGFDKQWQNKDNQTFTEFTNLEPGHYIFQMRAKYPNGQWQENLASISFTIMPFFWQTIFFKLFVALCLCLATYTVYRFRMVTIERRQIKLKNLVAQQTIDLQKQAELFAYQANHDQLTGLFNRRAFDHWCNEDFALTKATQQPLTIAILDIDNFKHVNDEFSHLIGDKVIKAVADILQQLVKNYSPQTKIARWGGEEFTMLISDKKTKAYDFCELVRASIKNHTFAKIATDLNITVSIGLTDNSEIIEYDRMISHADQALYFAKNHGRNQVRIYQKEDNDDNEKVGKRISQVMRTTSRIENN